MTRLDSPPRLRSSLPLLAITALLAACDRPAPKLPPAATKASLFSVPENQLSQLARVKVQRKAVSRPLVVPARVTFDSLRTSDVVPLVSGKVAHLFVREGDRVSMGQPLLSVSSPDSADAQAELEKDLAALANARQVLARDQDLYKHQAISLEELQQAQLDATSAKASVDSDRAKVKIFGTSRKDALLRSPIAGVVVARHIAVGEAVEAGSTPTFTVTDPSQVWVVGQLYQEDLRRVAVGDPAEIRSTAFDRPFPGRVTYIGASLDPDTLTIPVRIAVKNPGGLLKSGMYVDAAITPVKQEQTLLVPAAAVLRDEDNLPFVYVQASPGQFARRHVELGDQLGDDLVIRSGLKDGEQVIADGALFVQFAESLER